MEILILNPFFYPYLGGTEKHIYYLGSRLSKKHNITVLTAQLEGTSQKEEVNGMHIIRTPAKIFYNAPHPFPPPIPILNNFKRYYIEELKARKKTGIVHIHNRFIYNPVIGKIAKKEGNKLLLTIHNARPKGIDFMTDFGGGLFDDLIAQNLMRECNGIIGVSHAAYLETVPIDYKGRGETIHNGVDENVFCPAQNGKKNNIWKERFEKEGLKDQIVLTNARLLEQKGLKYLIEGMKNIHNASLVIFGRGPLQKELEKEAKRNSVKLLFITEKITEEELVKLYQAADVFVLPSLYEPCAVALLEAMSCGLPIIATDVGGNPELIKNNETGQIVKVRSAVAIEQAIRKYFEDDKIRNQYGENARKRVIKDLTWDKIALKLDEFYMSFDK